MNGRPSSAGEACSAREDRSHAPVGIAIEAVRRGSHHRHQAAIVGIVIETMRWLGSAKRSTVRAEPPAATSWPPDGLPMAATEKTEGLLQVAREEISPERSQE
mmetsp:Transcript_6519/g.17201  ORF Transcript_6519/g.17201 Transcript_6519/m.17201 type:complete len:103 (-) Transcript_6519:146-454(-)